MKRSTRGCSILLVTALLLVSGTSSAQSTFGEPWQQPVQGAADGPVLQGQDVRPGQRYAAGTRVRSIERGVALSLPPSWDAVLPAGAEALLLVSNTKPGLGLVMAWPSTSIEAMRSTFSGSQDLGDGVVLVPEGPLRMQGNVITGRYRAGAYAGQLRAVVAASGNGLAVVFAGPAATDYAVAIEALFRTVRFAAPRPAQGVVGVVGAGGGASNGHTREWQQFLAGMKLVLMDSYASSAGGYNIQRTLHLCRDGSFAYFDSSLVSAGSGTLGGSSTGRSQRSGRWQIQAWSDAQAMLTLTESSGQVQQLRLDWDGASQATYLDGERVYRVRSELCP